MCTDAHSASGIGLEGFSTPENSSKLSVAQLEESYIACLLCACACSKHGSDLDEFSTPKNPYLDSLNLSVARLAEKLCYVHACT